MNLRDVRDWCWPVCKCVDYDAQLQGDFEQNRNRTKRCDLKVTFSEFYVSMISLMHVTLQPRAPQNIFGQAACTAASKCTTFRLLHCTARSVKSPERKAVKGAITSVWNHKMFSPVSQRGPENRGWQMHFPLLHRPALRHLTPAQRRPLPLLFVFRAMHFFPSDLNPESHLHFPRRLQWLLAPHGFLQFLPARRARKAVRAKSHKTKHAQCAAVSPESIQTASTLPYNTSLEVHGMQQGSREGLHCSFQALTRASVLSVWVRPARHTARGPHGARESFSCGLRELSQLRKMLRKLDLE